MGRDRENYAANETRKRIAARKSRIAALVSDARLAELEAAVSSGRPELQWQLDLVRSARACVETNLTPRGPVRPQPLTTNLERNVP